MFNPIANTTLIIGGQYSENQTLADVEYFGPLSITIPPLSVAVYGSAAVYIDGTLYSCGGSTWDGACYKYDLAANSGTWENFTTIEGYSVGNFAVAFDDFFWYFNEKIRQVPVNGGSVTSYDWGYGDIVCSLGNGSHSVVILYSDSSVLMNSDTSFPTSWTTVVELNTVFGYCGCLWFGNTIYVTGGYDSPGGYQVNTTQLINMDTFELTLGAPLPVRVAFHGMGVIDGKPAIIGGESNSVISSYIYVYDYPTNTWSLSDRSLSRQRSFFGSVTF